MLDERGIDGGGSRSGGGGGTDPLFEGVGFIGALLWIAGAKGVATGLVVASSSSTAIFGGRGGGGGAIAEAAGVEAFRALMVLSPL